MPDLIAPEPSMADWDRHCAELEASEDDDQDEREPMTLYAGMLMETMLMCFPDPYKKMEEYELERINSGF